MIILLFFFPFTGLVTGTIEQLLRGIIRGLSIKGPHRQPEEVAFYVTILNMAGPLVHDFVSSNLFGPSLSKTRKDRERYAWFRLDSLYDNAKNVRRHRRPPYSNVS